MADPAATAQFTTLAGYLDQIGLGQLFKIDADGNPSGWLWNQIQAGVDSDVELQVALRQTDVFKERFGVIEEQQKRAAKGEPVYVMSPAEVIEYETRVKQMMSAAGLPSTFYDEPRDFHKLILNDMSPEEVGQRITQAYDYVLSAPPEVRATFTAYYGVGQGDAQLAAWALDPERTVRDITRATRTAYSGGMAERFGIKLDKAAAAKIADLPMGEAGIAEGFKNVAGMQGIFNEGLGDSGTDLTTDQGVASVFEGDASATQQITNRVLRRSAANRTSTGGAATTQEGVVGVGSS